MYVTWSLGVRVTYSILISDGVTGEEGPNGSHRTDIVLTHGERVRKEKGRETLMARGDVGRS